MVKGNITNDNMWQEKRKIKDERPSRKKAKTLTITMLENLWDFVNEVGEVALDRKAPFRLVYGNTYPQKYTHTQFSRHLYSLHIRGYLEYAFKGGRKSISFTNKAKLKILDKIVEGLAQDNRYRFVSFDIPEELRKNRDQFRRAIKQLGFKRIQKSLWVTNRNVSRFVEIAAYESGVEKYIVFIIAEKTDIDGLIEKMFESKKQVLNK
jgi:virulence-associated protein VapD